MTTNLMQSDPRTGAVRAGFSRGVIELRQTFTTGQDLWNYLFPTVIFLVVMLFMRGAHVPGTTFSLGSMTLPSVVGVGVAFSGQTLAFLLAAEREDGTLLRSKAVPHGMTGYLLGKIVLVSGMTLVSTLLVLVPGLFLFEGLTIGASWLILLWVLPLGMLATMPVGAIAGSLFANPRNAAGLMMLPMTGLIAISGIFYPSTSMPQWLQGIAQGFPIYWLGLGTRSALLPPEMAAVEIGQSWRHLETFAVLGIWAVVGLAVAPTVLRRMARRESGSSVEQRREKYLQRMG